MREFALHVGRLVWFIYRDRGRTEAEEIFSVYSPAGILRIPTPIHTAMASQNRTRHTNGTLLRKRRAVRQMAANVFLWPNVIGALGIANQTPPEHNPPETGTRERTT